MKQNIDKSSLEINPGVEQPSTVNVNAVSLIKQKQKPLMAVNEYVSGIINGNRIILGQAITLIESTLPKHQEIAQQIIEKCLSKSFNSIRIGITGVPGAGKSTLIEALGLHLIEKGKRLAILAVDPSSEKSKGSILGDKTRMEKLAALNEVFIRPSPTSGTLGGVARKTRETLILCEAAGYDTIFIETVGVGQSETTVNSMVDFFMLLILAGSGDELQGIKRGIMEIADLISITKADNDNLEKAKQAQQDFENALHYLPKPESGFLPKVILTSALKKTGINEIWENIEDYKKLTFKNGYFIERRKQQAKYWMYETINNNLKLQFYNNENIKQKLKEIENLVTNNKINPFVAANQLINEHYNKIT